MLQDKTPQWSMLTEDYSLFVIFLQVGMVFFQRVIKIQSHIKPSGIVGVDLLVTEYND